MKEYGYNKDSDHGAIIFEIGSEASSEAAHTPETPGLIVGSSEWGWINDEAGRRICAALKYFSETNTEDIEKQAEERFPL